MEYIPIILTTSPGIETIYTQDFGTLDPKGILIVLALGS